MPRIAGPKVAARIRREPDELVDAHRRRLVGAHRSPSARAELGFKAERSFDDIVRAHIEDELGGKIAS